MLYDYKCNNCDNVLKDVVQSMKDDALTHCNKCQSEGLERVIYGGVHCSVEQEPKTLKQQAEKNSKNMGHYEKQDREHADKLKQKEVRNELVRLGGMSKEQQQRYIEHG